ncbi:MAG: PPC domain-containing protein [Planctomycetales bacterium]
MRCSFRHGWGSLGFTLLLAGLPAVTLGQAAIPSIGSTAPQGAAPGQTMDVKVRGGNLATPTQLWTSFPAEVVLPTDIAGNGTNAAEVTYRLKLPADVAPGVYGMRLATAQGISNLKLFAVDDLPTVVQARPNQALAQAQAITLPAAIDGYVDNLTRDYYKFSVAAGQKVSFEVLGRRLGSPLDSMIRLLDSKGRELAYSDDAPGLGSDSMLSYTFKDAGEYVVELRDIRFQGNGGFLYRLRIGDFPCVTATFPMGLQKGGSASLAFAGPGAQEAQPVSFNLAADLPINWLNVGAKAPGGKSSGFAVVSVGANPETLEVEPNNEQPQATRVNLGAGINGRFDQPGDVDRYVFTAKAGQRFVFNGISRRQGSPSELRLRLLKGDGAEVVASNDALPTEAAIDYTFPADGDYTLVVEDLLGNGGIEFAYRVAVEPFQERFTLSASTDTINVPAGGLALVTITAVRGSFGGPISLSLLDAPEGVVATPAVIGPGLVTAQMTISCAPNVAPGKVYPIRIAGTSQAGAVQFQAVASLVDAQKAAFSGLSTPPQALTQMVALGVNPPPLFALKTDKPQIVFGKDLSATVKVQVVRTGDFAEEIALAVQPPPPAVGLPGGVTAAVKPIAKGTNEIEIVFSAATAAPLGEFSAVLLGTGKQGNIIVTQPIPALSLSLQAPFTLKPDFAGGNLAKGGTLKVKVVAERNPAYAGPIVLTFQNLPKGVTAAAATIAPDQKEVEVVLTAAADAAVGKVENVIIQGEGMNGNAKLTNPSSQVPLTVQ